MLAIRVGAAVLVAAALCVCGLLENGAAAQAPLTPVHIEVPNTGNLQFFALWVAVGAGYFQQQELHIDVNRYVTQLPQ